QGVVVCLRAPVATLLERLRGDTTRPLLDGPDASARVASLLEARALAYSEAHAVFDTSAATPKLLAERVARLWRRQPIAVAAGADSNRVVICNGALQSLLTELLSSGELGKPATRVVWVSDTNVESFHGAARQRML